MRSDCSRRDWLRSAAALAACGVLLPGKPRSIWAQESARQVLIVRSEEPLNAEPALGDLARRHITPVEHFYVRNHGPIPKIDPSSFLLRVEGLVGKPREWTLADIQAIADQRELEATLTCAGNRRQEMSAMKTTGGVQWDAGAIGHAKWGGATLASLLEQAELKPEAKHVWFEGLDQIPEKDGSVAPFGGSIPLARAMDAKSPALLAHAMNGEPLTAEHGFPLRTIVTGYIGARSVKWLAKIVVSDRPSPNHYVAEAYKIVATAAQDELAQAEPIYAFPINAAICTPAAGAKLKAGKIAVAGYALPPGDGRATIARVELSTDDGRTWTPAKLSGKPAPQCWQLWTADIVLTAGKHRLAVRATDSAAAVQPETCDWNLKGYLYNAWHRRAVEVA